MEIPVIVALDIGEDFKPWVWMVRAIHAQNGYDHPVDNLCLAISLAMEICGLGELGVQH